MSINNANVTHEFQHHVLVFARANSLYAFDLAGQKITHQISDVLHEKSEIVIATAYIFWAIFNGDYIQKVVKIDPMRFEKIRDVDLVAMRVKHVAANYDRLLFAKDDLEASILVYDQKTMLHTGTLNAAFPTRGNRITGMKITYCTTVTTDSFLTTYGENGQEKTYKLRCPRMLMERQILISCSKTESDEAYQQFVKHWNAYGFEKPPAFAAYRLDKGAQ